MLNTIKESKEQSLIESVDYFSCGYCINKIENIFSEVKKEKIIFEAGVFLIKHRKYGYILYDTGYSTKILKNKAKYFLYRFLNPINIKKEAMINFQLEKRGIKTKEIKYIILSHLHPDHIGGLEFFPQSKIIITQKCFDDLEKSTLRSLIFKELLPKDFKDRLKVIESFTENKNFKYLKSYDLFSDESILLTELDGHSSGQCCAYIKDRNLFIAADATWRTEFLDMVDKMKLLPRLIQNNFSEYKKSIDILKEIQNDGIKILVSHDKSIRAWKVLNEKNI
ncbi:MAG: MBL fold metallo-hydrolase [Fusobacterium sp.]|uniref:MBL fold metallo-hydrolase n=1 Tax=Fusobacterium sp. TaxID=68766 RepID=UPI0026DBBC8C|nr:MBL fold metallo-hydrolase [Fusobacterium sp.]MDO4689756.1 MBL fold metallo-hydrolase [Fusobacterium sp.]